MANLSHNLPLCKHRYVLMVSYVGTKYQGSQRLVSREKVGVQDTIQEAMEVALESVFPRTRCKLTAASRTDRGVHALMNCYSMPLMDYSYPTDKLKHQVNNNLMKMKHEVIVNEVLLAPSDFHPQRECVSREYIYRLGVPRLSSSEQVIDRSLFQYFPAHEMFRLLPVPKLNLDKLEEATDLFRGEHDFASFAYRPSEADNTVRTLEINVTPESEVTFEQERFGGSSGIYNLHFKSRAFLHNQIRRIVGAILSYASTEVIKLDQIKKTLDMPDSKYWPSKMIIAEPYGLYLSRLNYNKSSFDGTIKTYESESKEEVNVETIPGVLHEEKDHEGDYEDDAAEESDDQGASEKNNQLQ